MIICSVHGVLWFNGAPEEYETLQVRESAGFPIIFCGFAENV